MRTFSKISPRLLGNPNLEKVKKSLKELSNSVKEISPEGTLIVSVLDRGEGFYNVNKAIKLLQELEFIYSPKALQMNPELAIEYAEIGKSIETINKVLGKRNRERIKSRKERRTQREKRNEK